MLSSVVVMGLVPGVGKGVESFVELLHAGFAVPISRSRRRAAIRSIVVL